MARLSTRMKLEIKELLDSEDWKIPWIGKIKIKTKDYKIGINVR